MKAPKNKNEALDYLKSLETDFNMLISGEWDGGVEGCEASLEVISALIEFVEELK